MPIVLDNGSFYSKIGFAGEDQPRSDFPCLIGRPRYQSVMSKSSSEEYFIGSDAQSRRGMLSLNYPIENGVVKDWDVMEKIWFHAFFKDLQISPEEHPMLISEHPCTSKKDREKKTESMFETFDVPAIYLAPQGVLSLYSSGRTSGMVIDIGEGTICTQGMFEGFHIPSTVSRMNLGGRDLTMYMNRLLNANGYSLHTSAEHELVREIKERECYVAEDFHFEEGKSNWSDDLTRSFKLPDGRSITINSERFQAPEALFRPDLIGRHDLGIHQQLHSLILPLDGSLRAELYKNIVLCGGSSRIQGLAKRLAQELNSIGPKKRDVKIISNSDAGYSCWIGGSILGSLSSFHCLWMTKSEYQEHGAAAVHRFCPTYLVNLKPS